MPREIGYDQQIRPQPAARMPLSNAADYGAEVGQALGEFGAQRHRDNLEDYQIERRLNADREATDAAHKQALSRAAMDQATIDARNDPSIDLEQHVPKLLEKYDEYTKPIVDGITEDSVRNATRRQLDAQRASIAGNELIWVEGQRTANSIGDYKRTGDVSTARIESAPDEVTLDRFHQEELLARIDRNDGLRIADAKQKGELTTADFADANIAYLRRKIDFNPQAALDILASDTATKMGLDGRQIDVLRGAAEVKIAQLNAHAKQADAGFKSEYKDRLAAAKIRNEDGVPPDPATLDYLVRGADRLGDDSDRATVEGLVYEGALATAYQKYTPAQRQTERNTLAAKPNRTDDENRRLHWLQNTGDKQDAEFRADPVKWAIDHAAESMKPPPIAAGLPARAKWSHEKSAGFGNVMPFMSKDEALALQTRSRQSDAGKLDVVNELAALGGRDAINAARQVDPGDASLRQLVVLPANDRPLVLQGNKVRQTNKDLIGGDNGIAAQNLWRETVGTALDLFPADSRGAAFEAAKSLYAWDTSNSGEYDYKDDKFEPYVARGLATGIGERNGVKVLLPPKYSEDEFNRALQAWSPVGDKVVPWVKGPGVSRPMTRDEFLRTTPVARPDGTYEFHKGAGYAVTTKGGGTYLLRLPAKK